MTVEEALSVIQKIQDAWEALGRAITDTVQAFYDMFCSLSESDEVWPERNGTPPKKYGMLLYKRVRQCAPRYQFIPLAPRNRSY